MIYIYISISIYLYLDSARRSPGFTWTDTCPAAYVDIHIYPLWSLVFVLCPDFEALVREELFINPDEISHEELQRVWVYMDRDLSGGILAGEFGAFMRKGEATDEGPTWQQRRWMMRRSKADEVSTFERKIQSNWYYC